MMRDPIPTVVVTRHPDFADDISVHELDDVRLVYIDLGSEFERRPYNEDQAREWALSMWDDVKDLPDDHGAKAVVREVISYTVEDYLDAEQLDALLS